jgi:hypothetical protein
MEFSVLERLMVLSLLPKEGNFESLLAGRRLRPLFAFSDEEAAKLKFSNEAGGTIKWMDSVGPKEIDLTGDDFIFIASRLSLLNEAKKLTEHHLTLCEKFLN